MIEERLDDKGARVEVDDVGRAFLRLSNGASGSIEANWIAIGRKCKTTSKSMERGAARLGLEKAR
jgi:hypothetical protein